MFHIKSNQKSSREAGLGRVELILFCLGMLTVWTCSKYNPVSLKNLLVAPAQVVAKVGDGFVELSWVFGGDSTQVKEYRLYRKAQSQAAFQRLAATKVRRYRDERLTNGAYYQYQIVAVNKTGDEGERSVTITAAPAIYSLHLAGGAIYTNRRTITLTLTAPANTALMMLSNDSTFAAAAWEVFAAAKVWDLTAGDGLKQVFAKFRNSEDQQTSNFIRAKIILDTIASIKSIDEDSQGQPLKASNKLHLRLNAGEKKGTATTDIVDAVNNGQERNLSLYDDGSNGDPLAGDGIYERDYFIRPGLEVVNAYVYGRFTDAAGNVAPVATAPGRVTIQSPPIAVTLHEPTVIAGSSTSLSLRWTPNTDNDFASYQIRRSREAAVSLSSTLVRELTDAKVTSYVDNGLEPGTKYFYRVYVFDAAGNSTGSNIAQQATPVNEAPKPVVLAQPLEEASALKLSWSTSMENDFANYRIYRSTVSLVDTTTAPLFVISNIATTEYRDTGATAGITYFYRVFVVDKFGLSAGSNTVQGQRK